YYIRPSFLFFSHASATPVLYPLSLHDALPICSPPAWPPSWWQSRRGRRPALRPPSSRHSYRLPLWRRAPRRSSYTAYRGGRSSRSEEHTSELQSRFDLVCRLLLEKKKKKDK